VELIFTLLFCGAMSRALHRELMAGAIERDAEGQQALLAGDEAAAREAFTASAELYRRSWEEAPPQAYGRLVGMLKAGILAGEGLEQARYVRRALGDDEATLGSATASYARALAALAEGDDAEARRFSSGMAGSEAFERTARAITALAARDQASYTAAVEEIVRDFEQRAAHLTGVSIADTALMLERLASGCDMASGVRSPLLPV
jgi:hypothetical protein